MSTYSYESPGRGLSPNAIELGRQIVQARQLLQKQKQAQFRANAFFSKRPNSTRPAAHISPMRKDDFKSRESSMHLSLTKYELDDDTHLHKPGFQGGCAHLSTSHDNRNLQKDQLTSAKINGDELLEKWRAQNDMRKLEERLEAKTKEVAELQEKVDYSIRIAQDKDRSIQSMQAVWNETAAKQAVARQCLRHYIDDLADRAERAENEVEDLRTSLSLSRTASLSRASERSNTMSRHSGTNIKENSGLIHTSPDIMQYQYSDGDQRVYYPVNDGMYSSQGQQPIDSIIGTDRPSSRHRHVETPIHASSAQLASRMPHFQSTTDRLDRTAPQESLLAMEPSMSSSNLMMKNPTGNLSSSLLPGISSYIPTSSYVQTFSAIPISAPSQAKDPIYKDQTDWNDVDFLEDIMEDVMQKRAQDQRNSHHGNPRTSPTAASRGFSPLPPFGVEYPQNSPQTYGGDRVENDCSESDVSITSVSQWSEEEQGHYQKGKFLPYFEPKKRRAILFLVFSYLSTSTRLKCANVCREWRDVSRLPELWQYVHLRKRQVSSKFLKTIAMWCTQLKWLTLEKMSPRKQREDETRDMYWKKIRGCIEPGLEELLQAAGGGLLTLKIIECPHIITERVLWLASCHCRGLMSVTYISRTDPVSPEVVWALGAGCRQIQSLKIPPKHPCDRPKRFNSSCVTMIGRCWTQLKALSIGGSHVKVESLTLVVKSCAKLQVLELDHMIKITEEKAVDLCRHGLRGLHTLILKHTPITPSAIVHFNGACPQLVKISIHLSLSDFFPPPASPGQRKEFSRAIETLLVLSKKRCLEDTLEIRADYK